MVEIVSTYPEARDIVAAQNNGKLHVTTYEPHENGKVIHVDGDDLPVRVVGSSSYASLVEQSERMANAGYRLKYIPCLSHFYEVEALD